MHTEALVPGGLARRLIEHHRMTLIPEEGAWFALNHASADRVAEGALPGRYAGTGGRTLGSAIYALVTRRDFSAMHRLLSDETWHFYGGDAMELLLLHADGRSEVVRLGPDTLAGDRAQFTVPAGVWMGARPEREAEDAYSFFGCTMAPGFDYGDYEAGWRDELVAGWPAAAGLIEALTRAGHARRPGGVARSSEDAAEADVAAGRVVRADEAGVIDAGGGVTLREIVGRAAAWRGDAASVTRFRIKAGGTTGSSRYLGADECFYVLSGRGVAEIAGRRAEVGPGDVVVVRKGEPHALAADADGALEFLAVIAPAFNPAHYAPE
jgi:predicted cupin superfamily sugar epimerase/mannose-6-phosphate isomerase-like protein (cupin superfamily)